MTETPSLTIAQRRLLAEVQRHGCVHKNGRIRKTALALRNAGLITADWWPVQHSDGRNTEEWELKMADCPCGYRAGSRPTQIGCGATNCPWRI